MSSCFHLFKQSDCQEHASCPLEPSFVFSWLLQEKFEKRLEETPRKSLASALDGAAQEASTIPPLEDGTVVASAASAASALRAFGLKRLDKDKASDDGDD